MADPTFPAINPAINGFVLYQPVELTEGEALYPESYSPDVQATVEERLSAIVFQMNKAARLMRAFRFAQMAPLIGGLTDDINGFRVSRASTQPDTATAQYGDIWLQPDAENPGARIPRVFNGIGFVEGVYAVDAILMPIKGRLQALEAQGIDGFGELVDGLRDELRGEASSAANTFKKVEDLISALTTVVSGKAALANPAFTGVPTAPTAAPGTVSTQIATTAFVKAAFDALIDSAPGALDTLNELAAALGDDANFAASVTAALAGKQATLTVPGDVPGLTAALAGKQALLSGASGFVLAFDGAGAPVARPATIKLSSWYFTSDGVSNVTTAMQAFLNLGGDLLLAAGTYICGPLTIPANTRLYGARDAIIRQVTPSGDLITLQGDNTRLEGFTVDGNQTTNTFAGGYTANHRGIVCIGSSGTDRKEITLDQLEVKNFGDTGIFTRFTDGLKITGCKIFRCGYAGTQNLSPINYEISGNRVDDIFPGQTGNGNAYGITATSSTGERVAQRGIIAHNIVSNVPSWEGIDVHFGKSCAIRGNLVTGCSQGIAYENSIATLPGEDIAIDANTIVGWSGATLVRDGQTYTKTGGIIAVGAAANEYAKTLSLRGNNVTSYGDTRPGTAGAIFARNWDGYAINNNNIRDSFRSAISLGESGTAGMINGTINDNVINGVTAHNGVCRGIEATARCSGTAMGNHVAGLASGTERYYQDPAALNPIIFHAAPREVLQADRTYFVRADGSDSNTGRVDSAAGAWRNVQTAIDRIVAALDIPSGRTVTIKVGNGSYTEAKTLRNFVGGGLIVIDGSSSPSNVDFITSAAGVNAILADRINCRWHLKGFRIGTTGTGLDAINARGPGTVVTFENLAFDVTVDDHLQAWEGAQISAIGDYFITAGAGRHVNAFDGGRITILGRTVAISNTPAFTYFANAARQGVISANGMTFTGTGATGPRYLVDSLGLIFTNAGGANYLPGNAAGTANAPGAYL